MKSSYSGLCLSIALATFPAMLLAQPQPAKPLLLNPPLLAPLPAKPVLKPLVQTQAQVVVPGALPLPAWPVRFQLLEGERESAVFAVTQAGPVRLTMQSTGIALTLTLRRPDGRVLEQTGSGHLTIDTVADMHDLSKGSIWGVGVRPAQEAPPSTTESKPQPVSARGLVAQGTLSVATPPVDTAKATSAYHALQVTVRDQGVAFAMSRNSASGNVGVTRAPDGSAQAAFDRDVTARHLAELDRLRSLARPQAMAGLKLALDQRLQGVPLARASVIAGNFSGLVVGSNTAGANPGPGPSVAPPMLSTVSRPDGDPGTPLVLQGTHFGNVPGEVHFSLGSGRIAVAKVPSYGWSDSQLELQVPLATGVAGPVDGVLWVRRADGVQSGALAFRYTPAYETREIYTGIYCPDAKASSEGRCTVPDSRLAPNPIGRFVTASLIFSDSAMLWGYKGDDEFYVTSRLQNGWLMHSARLLSGPVYFSLPNVWPKLAFIGWPQYQPDTDRPYVKVHWWMEPAMTSYAIYYAPPVIVIKRPVGLPCSSNPCAH